MEKIVKILESFYKNKIFAVEKYKSPYQILISCIISLRTKDEVTDYASKKLFKVASTPFEMVKLNEEKIQNLIYPAGFYRRKSSQILKISKILIEKYNGEVPDNLSELLELPGVGIKTANLVLSKGFNIPAICVDIHVHRISNRLGFVKTKSPEETEKELKKILPKNYWIIINHLFVHHGRETCLPRNPRCKKCPVENYCAKKI